MQRETIRVTGEGKLRNHPRPRSKKVDRLEFMAAALTALTFPIIFLLCWA